MVQRKKKNEGGGEYRILENGKVFDKVGVNFSEVYGNLSKKLKRCTSKFDTWNGA